MSLTLTLTLERRDEPACARFDDTDNTPPPAVITLSSADLEGESVHRWFRLFEQVLTLAGFQEATIVGGACGLAFNDQRPPALMRRTARYYELADVLAEAADPAPAQES